jgi:carboxypeptidase C (cathepsin A)
MPMKRGLASLALLLCLIGAAAAEETPQPQLPALVTTHHTVPLANGQLGYDAIAEILPLTDTKGDKTASVYTVSYVAPGAERPVTFVFNGGPGAAAVFLHLGAIGPRLLETPPTGAAPSPPYRLIDNPDTWLGFTDLVFVDPVGTGFSHAVGKGDNPDKPFWDVHADIASLAAVVRLWLTRHERWRSPVYLAGESYGGFRAAVLARSLPHEVGVTVSGLVLISPALDLSLLGSGERDLLRAAFALPTEAATSAVLDGAEADLAAVEHFALSDYLVGLAAMRGVPPAGDPLMARVASLTGLPEPVVRQNRGRVSPHLFAHEIRRAAGEVVSQYDGTVARHARTGEDGDDAGDTVLDGAVAAYTAAFNTYARAALGYKTDLPYRTLASEVSRQWNWDGARGGGHSSAMALSSLEAALFEHPRTKVMIVNGRYDLVTPYLASRWLVDQLAVPPELRTAIRLRVYEGGHMMYMRPQSRAALARDAAELYGAAGATPAP